MKMLDSFSRMKTGFWIMSVQNFIAAIAFSFDFVYFREQGYSLWWLILIGLMMSGTSILVLPFIHTFSVRKYLFSGFVLYSLAALAVVLFQRYALVPYSLLLGLTMVFFWVPLNYIFFGASAKNTNALDSWWYQVPGNVIAFGAPLLGLAVIRLGGYVWLFGIGAILFLIPPIVLRKRLPEETIRTDFVRGIQGFKTLKTITVSEGALHFFNGAVLHAYTLLFLKTPTGYGWFLSYLGLLGFIIALFLARQSDKTQLRKGYLTVVFILMAIIIISMIFVKSALGWWVLMGAFTVISTVSWPLRLAVSLDAKKATMDFWVVREFLLNVGRAVTLGISLLFFYYELYWPVFVMFGIITLAYPLLVHYKLKEIR